MRIEAFGALVAVVWLTAVLCTRLVAANNETLNFSLRKPRDHHLGDQFSSRWSLPLDESSSKRMSYPEMQELIRKESGPNEMPVECCPTVEEMVEPQGGINRNNMYVELYRDDKNQQRFYEYSCKAEVLDKPCRFLDRKLQHQSRCVQKFSYTYAIVQNSGHKEGEPHGRHHHSPEQHQGQQFKAFPVGASSWTLDYIKVRSGCSCEISPKPRKRKLAAMKVKRTRSSRSRSHQVHHQHSFDLGVAAEGTTSAEVQV